MKYYFIIPFISLLLCFSSASWAEEYYTWTDKDGNTHISNTPVSEPPKKSVIKKHSFDEASPEERKAERRVQDYKYKMYNKQSDLERQIEQDREDAEKREQSRNRERCEEARKSEREYRNKWINAKGDHNRNFWKRRVDEIESICKKAEM